MGGGGGGRSGGGGLKDLSGLMTTARTELRRAEGRMNVFLSFTYEDLNEVNLLRGQAKNEKSDIEFNDWSVREPYNSERASYIKQKIGERISQCSVVVVYVSSNTAQSSWVTWEVEEAIQRGKRVVAVHKGTTAPTNLPPIIGKYRINVVPWASLGDELKK